ncbi:MAG: penicillin-binding protein 2 [Gammaproteobacteria bacterium]|nr:penicillin-binding protein 2 [Gammaproteobacteria bacterium]
MKHFTLHNPRDEIRHYRHRIVTLGIAMVILLVALILRLGYLQIVQHKYYLTLSKQNLLSVAPIDPSRGLIYDRNGSLLAGNTPVFSLDVIPDKIKHLNSQLVKLREIIDLSTADIDEFNKQLTQNRKFNPIPLKVKLTEAEMSAFAVNQYRFPGFFIQARLIRDYPSAASMEPVLGYVGRINAKELTHVDQTNYSASNYIGKEGVEKYYEKLLHGTVGIQQIETSAAGEVVRSRESRQAVAGDNLYLTIDTKLENSAENALKGYAGAVVAIDPRNGEVLALVSTPSFDPNPFITGISSKAYQTLRNDPSRPLYNRALQGEFPPGSTVKPFYAMGALANHLLSPTYHIFDPGQFLLPNSTHIYHDWKKGGHGWVNVSDAITESCDVFFFKLAQHVGIEEMGNTLKLFGFGQPTNIDTDTELDGLVPSPEWKEKAKHAEWYPGDTISAGIGQGYILTTPLQLATAAMRLVDKGGGFAPHLLLKTETPAGVVVVNPPQPLANLNLPQQDFDIVLNAMRGVVSDPRGTAYQAGHTAKYTFGGKSGTAQVFSLQKGQKDKAGLLPKKLRDHSWFMSFVPAHQPTMVMVVFLEHGGEGKAQFITRQILDSYETAH